MKRAKQTAVYREESRLFYVALLSCVLSVSSYMYFVSMSVVDVVMRKEADSQIAEIGTSVSQLESQYIEMQHSVSSDIATMKGFVSADKKVFINKHDDTLVFLHN